MIVPKSTIKKVSSEKINAEDVYNEGLYYFDATTVLENYRENDTLFPPVIMNAMFSCELFSKSIIYSYNCEPQKSIHCMNYTRNFLTR